MPQKANGATAGEKLLQLFTIMLFSKGKLSLTTLAEKLDCSKQTVLRLIPQLEQFGGGRIYEEKQSRETVYWMEKPKKINLNINADGLRELMICKNFLSHITPTSLKKEMDIALLRAGEYVGAESFDMAQFSNIGVTINKGSIDYSSFQTQHDTLVKAIAEQCICSVSYNVGSGLKTRSIAPVNIVMLNGTIYVHGWVMLPERAEPKYDSPLKLSLHKITDVQLEPRHWKALPDIDKSSFGLLGTDNIKANVKFVDYAADYVASRKWSEDQTIEDCEDGIILTFTASSRVELISWVLSFGAQAELLAPVDIRAEIGRELAKAAGMYDL